MKKILLTISILLISVASYAQVLGTNTVIPEGTCAGGVAATDLLCANSADHNITINANNGTSFNIPQTVYSTGSYTNATTGFTSVTGLAFPVSANRNYNAECTIIWQGSANTTGPKYQFTGPAAPTAVVIGAHSDITASTYVELTATAFASAIANTGTITTATNFNDHVTIAVINGANAGTVQLQAAANGAGTLTIANGSFCTFK